VEHGGLGAGEPIGPLDHARHRGVRVGVIRGGLAAPRLFGRRRVPDGDGRRRRPGRALDPAARSTRMSLRTLRMALATNVAVVVLAGVVAIVLLVLALQRGI